ncbi:MAG: YncE family protein [Vicinamibacterales bacterium]
MHLRSKLFVATACVLISVATGMAQGQYAKLTDIQIGGAGAFDYLNVDSAAHRLYVTHGTEVVVIDTTTNTIVGRIADTPRVHGIALVPEINRGFTTNGGENKVSIVDLKTLATISKVDTGGNPDAVLYEPSRKEIYSFNGAEKGGFNATVIDTATASVVATIPLGDKPETGQADPAVGRVFVNLEDKNLVGVIDIATHQKVAEWPLAPVTAPTGMAIDRQSKRLYVGGGKFLAVVDYTTGKVITSVPICTGTDATWIDDGLRLIFNSCSDGNITISHIDGPDKVTVVATLATARGARTMTLDPVTHRLYTAAQNFAPLAPGAPAATRPTAIADSFHVLVFEMKQ